MPGLSSDRMPMLGPLLALLPAPVMVMACSTPPPATTQPITSAGATTTDAPSMSE